MFCRMGRIEVSCKTYLRAKGFFDRLTFRHQKLYTIVSQLRLMGKISMMSVARVKFGYGESGYWASVKMAV